jgi:iron complex outermembrane receptor protein
MENNLRRQLSAAFTEIEAPLLDGERFPIPFRGLSVSLAGRYEHYRDFGRSVAVPRIGFEWAPVPGARLTLRGGWGWSIRAPDLGNLSDKANTSVPYSFQATPILVWSGGNPRLDLERALTRTLGLKWSSGESDPFASLELGYFNVVYQNRIDQAVLESDILTDPLYANYVIHNPDPSTLAMVCGHSTFSEGSRQDCLHQQLSAIVDLRLHNLHTLWTDGIDAQAKVSVNSPYGTWGLGVAGTYVLDYAQSQTPQAPLSSLLNTESEPLALHSIATAWWKVGPVKAILTVRHAGRYRDPETNPVTRVGSGTTTDARLSYTFGISDAAPSRTFEVAAFCQNVPLRRTSRRIGDTMRRTATSLDALARLLSM